MSRIQFNQLFGFLLAMAFVCAFLLPGNVTDRFRINIAGIFAPLSYPARSIARALHGSVASEPVQDNRAADDVVTENQWLKSQVLGLQADVARLQRLEAESQTLGDLRSLCVRATVVGNDAGGRDTLLLSPGISSQVADNAPAVYDGGLAGRVAVGVAGARLRLISDVGMSVSGRFVRIATVDNKPVETPIKSVAPLVQGSGQGGLLIRDLKKLEVQDAALRKGDWVVVDDADYPESVQGWRIGQVTEAHDSRQAPGFVEITVTPQSMLNRLPDVWVLRSGKQP